MERLILYCQFSKLIITRELKSTFRQKIRLLSALVRPLLWLWILGFGLSTLTKIPGVEQYQIFLVPGLLSLVLLFGCIFGSMSFVMDQQAGLQRLISTAPVHRSWVIITSMFSISLIGLVQVMLLLCIVAPLGYIEPNIQKLHSIGALILIATTCSSIGLALSTSMRHFQGFASIVNFLLVPMFFLSGALYPTQHMPAILQTIIYANPFAHGVNLMHHYFNITSVTLTQPWVSVSYLIFVTVMGTILAIRHYTNRFC